MPKRAGVGVGFLIAAACGLAVGLLVPPLLPFVLLGVALGLVPALVGLGRRAADARARRTPSRMRGALAVAGVLAGCTSAALVAALALHGGGPSSSEHVSLPPIGAGGGGGRKEHSRHGEPRFFGQFRTDSVAVTYTGEGVQLSDPERLALTDRLLIPRAALARTPSAELRALAHGMAAEHWRPAERTSGGLVFQRRREMPLDSRTFPPETGNTIALPRVAVEDHGNGVTTKLVPGAGSRLTLVASPDTFGPSFPTGVRQTRPVSGLEQIAISVDALRKVEVDLRSPLFRNELLAGLADGSLFGVLRWVVGLLVAAAIALFNEELKQRLGRLLKRWRRQPRPATG